jgi:hypothetical protein
MFALDARQVTDHEGLTADYESPALTAELQALPVRGGYVCIITPYSQLSVTVISSSGHELEEQECRKNHQMNCSLHYVSSTGAESDSTRQKRQRKQRDVLGLQT